VRLLHTSDWHLGHTLHELPRRFEHQAFLAWLLEEAVHGGYDALLIAGDVFDTANPPADAQADFYGFLAALSTRAPQLQVVVIAGNHDSASRLDAPREVLGALRVRVVGALPRGPGGELDVDRLILPLQTSDGRTGAWVIAMPFLRSADLDRIDDEEGDPLILGVQRRYEQAVAAARARRAASDAPTAPIVAMGHLYMVGSALSELSERRILGGNQHALPVDLFPADLAYVALGHLHKAQRVGGAEHIRYCGSPIPLSFSEVDYLHQVLRIELHADQPPEVRPVPIPRAVELLRLPAGGAGAVEAVLDAIRALPPAEAVAPERWPFIEVRARIDGPSPRLRADVEAALAGRAARLARLAVEHGGTGEALAAAAPGARLRDLSPDAVFRLRWAQDHEGSPPADLLALLHEVVEAVGQAEVSP
jgi:exonuclease SbcD